MTDTAPGIHLSFDCNTNLFAPDMIALFAERYDALIAAAETKPCRPISELPIGNQVP